jgi:hypothetical protein
MYVRVTTIKLAPGGIEDAVRHFEEVTLPQVRKLSGFMEATALVDRHKGTIQILAEWDSRKGLDESAETARRLRARFVETTGDAEIISIETLEVVLREVSPDA